MAHTDRITRIETIRDSGHITVFQKASLVFHEGEGYLVRRTEADTGQFSLLHCTYHDYYKAYFPAEGTPHGVIYQPPHPSVKAEDVTGSTYVYDDGTYFHFAHCSPQEQIDFAARARTFAISQFALPIAKAEVKVAEATNAPVKATAVAKVSALVNFAEAVGAAVHSRVVGETLGHFHRDPHQDHKRDLALLGIAAVKAQWTTASTTNKAVRGDLAHVTSTISDVERSLTTEHDIEWRAARQKRLDDAAAAKGTDPVGGYEYVYAQASVPAAITGEANLPDPAWNFDQLRTGAVVRGSYVYTDGQPTPNAFLPWVIRFKRPIPEGTVAGADIGSVAWEQETAYSPATA